MKFASRNTTIRTISALRIPKAMLASAARVNPARVTDFIQRRPVPIQIEQRLISAAEGIAFIWKAFRRGVPGLKIVIDNPQLLRRMVAACKHAELSTKVADAASEANAALQGAIS